MSVKTVVSKSVSVVCVVVWLMICSASVVSAQPSPSNNWHKYGGIISIGYAFDRVVYNVQEQNGNVMRVECMHSEMGNACFQIAPGHWVVLDGYTKGVGTGCYDGANNEDRITKILRWNWLNDTWEEIKP